jgi:hypothetical protein
MIADPRLLPFSGSHFAMYIYVISLVPNGLTFCSLFMGEKTRAPETFKCFYAHVRLATQTFVSMRAHKQKEVNGMKPFDAANKFIFQVKEAAFKAGFCVPFVDILHGHPVFIERLVVGFHVDIPTNPNATGCQCASRSR